jgi:enediyne biosynthesis protein E4
VGRGLAVGDLDDYGRQAVVVTTNDGSVYLLHNETTSANNWLTLDLVGHRSNRDAIGAEVKVVTSGGPQWLTISPAGSYLRSSDKRAHFGLGMATEETVQIHWPSGVDEVLKNVKANQIVKIDEPVIAKPSSAN